MSVVRGLDIRAGQETPGGALATDTDWLPDHVSAIPADLMRHNEWGGAWFQGGGPDGRGTLFPSPATG
jgi:hypothetical protein